MLTNGELHIAILSVHYVGWCVYSQAIHKLTEYLCFQVKNIAKEAVDVFDLPDYVTRAPIGMQSAEDAYSVYTQYAGF